jgi:2-polyprenyl-3-methyl-5-hydroxy-6-metoxy-1,4-benzoquinol methylase
MTLEMQVTMLDSATEPTGSGRGETEYLAYEMVNACPICASANPSVFDEEASVVRCRGCGHRYVDPRPTQQEIARGYSLPTSYDDWIQAAAAREAMWVRRFDQVLRATPPGRLLDIGAGIGTFLAIARDRGWSVDGTEVSTTAIVKAREQHGIALGTGLVEHAAPPGPYDAICLWHVLEHLPNPVETLRFCRGLMSEHGQIVLAMPNDGDAVWALTMIGNLVRRLIGRASSRRYQRLRPGVESHIQHFDPKSIRKLLSDTGFRIESITVDDASPKRSRLGSIAFAARRLLTRVTPWHFGREMLVIARPAP